MERDLAPLPAPMASIIGRESEIAIARGLVERDDVRLVTLTGPAGVGKTRLALEIAAQSGPAFNGRVSYVALATLSDTGLLLGEIASALGVPDSADPVTGIREQLRALTRLLVLDNLEQLPGAGLALAPLLKAVAGLTVLATSRVRLDLYGEYILPIDPLSLPAAGADYAELEQNPAIQLLVDASRSANAAFDIPPSDFPVLAEIARQVDGLPLALELAGAYIPLLGAHGVLGRLGDRFSVLSGGPGDLPERLRTMHNAVAWSYDLLIPEERAFFRRLCVFNGGFTLEMAEAMVRGWQPADGYPYLFGIPMPSNWIEVGREAPDLSGGEWTPPPLAPLSINAIAGLDSLVQQYLVRAVRSEQGGDRFQLLETMREFGLEQLDRAGERDAAEHARAVLMMAIAEISSVTVIGDSWRVAVAWIEAELPNIRAALAWVATQPPPANQIGLRMVETLWIFWQSRGYVREGCAHLEACLARPGGLPVMRAQAQNLLAALYWFRNDLVRATAALDEALSLLDRIGFLPGQGRNFLIRALVAWNQGDYERMEKMTVLGRDRFDRAHHLHQDDPVFTAICPLLRGISARAMGDRPSAAASFNQAYQEWQNNWAGAFLWGMAIAQYFLGEMAREDGDRAAAVSNIRDALDTFVDLEDPWTVGGCVGTLATYLVADDELEEAARLLGAAHELESSHGIFLPPTETAVHEVAARDLRERIGPDDFAVLFAEGRRFSLREAAARAMVVPMESRADRAARLAGAETHPLMQNLNAQQLRTLQFLADRMAVKQIARVEGRAPSSIYERIDNIKKALGLPQDYDRAALIQFVTEKRMF